MPLKGKRSIVIIKCKKIKKLKEKENKGQTRFFQISVQLIISLLHQDKRNVR